MRGCALGQEWRTCAAFESIHASNSGATDLASACPCAALGTVRKFTFVVTQDTIPNILVPGQTRTVVQVNGTVPGPTIFVDEWDWVEVRVLNRMRVNSTSIHWHGMVQYDTPYSDGVPFVTQCPIGAGQEVTYVFRASLSGTFWWHSHLSMQYTDGAYGALVIARVPLPGEPTDAELYGYGSDWLLTIQDFYNNGAMWLLDDYYLTPISGGDEPIPDAIVVNGLLSGNLSFAADRASRTRLRFIAANSLSEFQISVDGVRMLIIETDGTLTEPTPVASFSLNVGQRISVVVDWGEVPANVTAVFVRITALADMYATNITDYVPDYDVPDAQPLNPYYLATVQFAPLAGGVVQPNYEGVLSGPPAPPQSDSNQMNAAPVDRRWAPYPTHFMYAEVDFFTAENGVNYGSFNDISSVPDGPPVLLTLLDYYDGGPVGATHHLHFNESSPSPIGTGAGLVPILHNADGQYAFPYGAVVEILINNTDTGDHPMHLHSHPFWLVATSEWPGAAVANRANYPRRDVVSVEAGGWALLWVVADVPGVFVLHCHIEWHLAAGLLLTVVEAPEILNAACIPVPLDFLELCAPVCDSCTS